MANRSVRCLVVGGALGVTLLGGCQHARYVGTWSSAPGSATGEFEIGGMTLAGDMSYTAFASYSGRDRGFSGEWSVERSDEWGEMLVFASAKPGVAPVKYRVMKRPDGSLVVTDPKTNSKTVLVRQ